MDKGFASQRDNDFSSVYLPDFFNFDPQTHTNVPTPQQKTESLSSGTRCLTDNFEKKNLLNDQNSTEGQNMNGHSSLLHDHASIRIENLKKENAELKDADLKKELVLANLEKRLSQSMKETLNHKSQNDILIKQNEMLKKEIEVIKNEAVQLQIQVNQYKEMKFKKDEDAGSLSILKKDLSLERKNVLKWKNDAENLRCQLGEKNTSIEKLTLSKKNIWNLMIRFARKLSESGNLTDTDRNAIVKEFQDENVTIDDMNSNSRDQNDESDQQASPEVEKSSHVLINSHNLRRPVSEESSSHSAELSPNNNIPLDRISNIPQPLPSRSSNFFRKTCEEVIRDPHISEDCMDVSSSEVNAIKKQLGFGPHSLTPLSPVYSASSLPNYNQFALNHQNQMLYGCNRNIDEGGRFRQHPLQVQNSYNPRLPLRHQCSEGFDTSEDPQSNTHHQGLQNSIPMFGNTTNSPRMIFQSLKKGDLQIGVSNIFKLSPFRMEIDPNFIKFNYSDGVNPPINTFNSLSQATFQSYDVPRSFSVSDDVNAHLKETPTKMPNHSVYQEPSRLDIQDSKDAEPSDFAYHLPEETSMNVDEDASQFSHSTPAAFYSKPDKLVGCQNAMGDETHDYISEHHKVSYDKHYVDIPTSEGVGSFDVSQSFDERLNVDEDVGQFNHNTLAAFNTEAEKLVSSRNEDKTDSDMNFVQGIENTSKIEMENKSVRNSQMSSLPKITLPKESNLICDRIVTTKPNDGIKFTSPNLEMQDAPISVLVQNISSPVIEPISSNNFDHVGCSSIESNQFLQFGPASKPLDKETSSLDSLNSALGGEREQLINMKKCSITREGRDFSEPVLVETEASDKSDTNSKRHLSNDHNYFCSSNTDKPHEADKYHDISKLDSVSMSTISGPVQNEEKEVLHLHSEIQIEQSLYPGKNTMLEHLANGSEKNENLPLVMDNCPNMVPLFTDCDTRTPFLNKDSPSSEVALIPDQKEFCNSVLMQKESQDFEMVDLGKLYTTPVNQEFEMMFGPKVSNEVVEDNNNDLNDENTKKETVQSNGYGGELHEDYSKKFLDNFMNKNDIDSFSKMLQARTHLSPDSIEKEINGSRSISPGVAKKLETSSYDTNETTSNDTNESSIPNSQTVSAPDKNTIFSDCNTLADLPDSENKKVHQTLSKTIPLVKPNENTKMKNQECKRTSIALALNKLVKKNNIDLNEENTKLETLLQSNGHEKVLKDNFNDSVTNFVHEKTFHTPTKMSQSKTPLSPDPVKREVNRSRSISPRNAKKLKTSCASNDKVSLISNSPIASDKHANFSNCSTLKASPVADNKKIHHTRSKTIHLDKPNETKSQEMRSTSVAPISNELIEKKNIDFNDENTKMTTLSQSELKEDNPKEPLNSFIHKKAFNTPAKMLQSKTPLSPDPVVKEVNRSLTASPRNAKKLKASSSVIDKKSISPKCKKLEPRDDVERVRQTRSKSGKLSETKNQELKKMSMSPLSNQQIEEINNDLNDENTKKEFFLIENGLESEGRENNLKEAFYSFTPKKTFNTLTKISQPRTSLSPGPLENEASKSVNASPTSLKKLKGSTKAASNGTKTSPISKSQPASSTDKKTVSSKRNESKILPENGFKKVHQTRSKTVFLDKPSKAKKTKNQKLKNPSISSISNEFFKVENNDLIDENVEKEMLNSTTTSPDPLKKKVNRSLGVSPRNAKKLKASQSVSNDKKVSPISNSQAAPATEKNTFSFKNNEAESEAPSEFGGGKIHQTQFEIGLLDKPSETEVLSETSNTTTKPSSFNCCVASDSSLILEMDSESDSPLVIDFSESEHNPVDPVDTIEKFMTSETNQVQITKKRKRKKSASNKRKSPNKKAMNPSNLFSNSNSIESVFKVMEKIEFTDGHFNIFVHNLVNALINPEHSPDLHHLLFHVIQYLQQTKRNPLIIYGHDHDASNLLPISEKCIVTALFQVEKKGKPQFHGLINSTVLTLYNLVLGKENVFHMYGQASLCRILTEVCKRQNDRDEILKFCAELLKFEHQYATYLIASIIGVWKEAFQSTSNIVEEKLFFAAVARGVENKPQNLSCNDWKHCKALFSNLLPFPAITDLGIPVGCATIVHTIRVKCLHDVYDKAYLVTTPLVIYSRVKGWSWASSALMETFIVRSLQKFSQELVQIGFEFLLNLYAEISYHFPKEENPSGLLEFYFGKGDKDVDFIPFTAAIVLLKFNLWRQEHFSKELSDFMCKWAKHAKVTALRPLFIRSKMRNEEFCIEDIIDDS